MRTDPDSSIVNPAHMNITNAPQIRNEKVLKTNIVSFVNRGASDRRHQQWDGKGHGQDENETARKQPGQGTYECSHQFFGSGRLAAPSVVIATKYC